MNQVELAEHRLTVALFLDMEKQADQWLDRDRAESEYNVKLTERLFASIVHELESRGWAITWTDIVGGEERTAAMLNRQRHAQVLKRILEAIQADTFEVDWQTKRILTDAEHLDSDRMMPCPNGWMLLFCERTKPKEDGPSIQQREESQPQKDGFQLAAGGINNFYGPATQNHGVQSSESSWTKWGTIAGIIGVLLAVVIWYFSDDFPWKAQRHASPLVEQKAESREVTPRQ